MRSGDFAGITRARQDGYGFWTRDNLNTVVVGSELMATTDVEGDGAPDVIAAAKGAEWFNVLRNQGQIIPGPSAGIHVSASTPPGEKAGWFWSTDCGNDCDGAVPGGAERQQAIVREMPHHRLKR